MEGEMSFGFFSTRKNSPRPFQGMAHPTYYSMTLANVCTVL
jgi:hypothetical protein